MKLIINYMLRTVWKSKIKAVIVVFSFAFMAALFYVNIMTFKVGPRIYRENNQLKYGSTDVICRSNDDENPFFDEKDVVVDLEKIKGKVQISTFIANFENNDITKRILIYSGDTDQMRSLKLVSDSNDEYISDGKSVLLVKRSFIEKNGFEEGKVLELSYFDNKCDVVLRAISDDKKGIVSQTNIYDIAIADKTVFEKLFGSEYMYNSVYYELSDSVDKAGFIEDTNTQNKTCKFSSLIDEESEKSDVNTITMILLIVLIIIVVLSTSVIIALYNHIFESHVPVIGTFRSIGIGKSRINILLMSETVFYGLAGGILGVLIGRFFFRYMINALIGDINIGNDYKILYMCLTVLFPVLWSLVVTMLLLKKTHKRTIISIIRTVDSKVKAYSIHKYIPAFAIAVTGVLLSFSDDKRIYAIGEFLIAVFIILIIPITVFYITRVIVKFFGNYNKIGYSMNSIVYNRLIIRSMVIFSISLGLIIPIFAAKNSLNNYMDFANKNFSWDIIIGTRNNKQIPYDEIVSSSEVKDAFFLYENSKAYLKKESSDEEIGIKLLGRDYNDKFDSFLKNSIIVEGELLKQLKGSKNIIVDEIFSEKHSIKVGDTVRCRVNNYEDDFTVIGFSDTYKFSSSSNVMMIDLDLYKENLGESLNTIYIRSESSPDDAVREIDQQLINYEITIKTREDFFGSQIESNDSIMKMITAVVYFSLAICFIGIANNQISDFLNRKKEFAVLISTSMSHNQLKRLLVLQVIFSAVFSIIFGILLSVFCTRMLSNIVSYFRILRDGFTYPVFDSLMISAVAFLMFMLLISVPMYIITKIDIYYQLRRE